MPLDKGITQLASGAIIIDKPEGIAFYQLLAARAALGIELKTGLVARTGNPYRWAKKVLGLKGTKQKVYDQLCVLVEKVERGETSALHVVRNG